ncbi:MAG TPA: hypothetical protein VLT61_15475 [Anaeromyxobacteraceae bacterium]|nr:hypothetical protein [Anaeromyxobacteraceae bacterium]
MTRVLSTWRHAALQFEPLGSRYFTASYVTASDGRVSLPSLPVRLSGHEYLRTESIFVNLEAPPVTRIGTPEQEEGDRLGSAYLDGTIFRPFASNEGLVIVTEPNSAAASERHDRWKGVLQRWRRVQGGLERPEAELVILLAPSAPAGAVAP